MSEYSLIDKVFEPKHGGRSVRVYGVTIPMALVEDAVTGKRLRPMAYASLHKRYREVAT